VAAQHERDRRGAIDLARLKQPDDHLYEQARGASPGPELEVPASELMND
jgi:hypothetical protein